MKRPARAPPPLMTLALTASILAVFTVELAGDGAALCAKFGLVPARPSFGAALASLFFHDPSGLAHIGGNVLVLILIGAPVERAIGSTRFSALYFFGGLAGVALHIVVDPTSTVSLVGCSGALFALLAVAASLFGPSMLAFAAILVVSNIWHAFGGSGDDGVSFGCHLGGFLAGTMAVAFARLRGVDLRHAVTA